MKYNLDEIHDDIFHVSFNKEDHYDLCMLFVRYQEFYECPNDEFRGKHFDLFKYMEWYAKKYGDGVFTYSRDWSGFNLPLETIDKCSTLLPEEEFNIYDATMANIVLQLKASKNLSRKNLYLIGSSGDDKEVISHELAHGLFYTNIDYKTEMTSLVEKLGKNKNKIFKELRIMGYTEEVLLDEAQAYLTTDPIRFGSFIRDERKNFQETFNKYIENSNE